ncbi:MAG: ABC transporter ATP-binding protein [Alphaproteobacteria bacterium]|nr:ABC transporter ATP-binding protein [Alphaproteobacteria bacterium]
MIELSGIHVRFNRGSPMETHALRGVDLTLADGEFVTVIGSNGSGKSTLLNVLAGDVPPDSGRVTFDGTDVTARPAAGRAGDVARVFQDPLAGSCEQLTIEENLALAASRGARRSLVPAVTRDRRERFRARLAALKLGLENRLQDRMGLLSGGQRQAVALVMATLRPIGVLLLDEHTAALDPRTAGFVMDLTDRLVAEQKLTTLMVTHSMRLALDHGRRTIMLHEGRAVLDVSGPEREGLGVEDMLHLFERVRGEELSDDSLVLD